LRSKQLRAKLYRGNILIDHVTCQGTSDHQYPDIIHFYSEEYYYQGVQDGFASYQHREYCDINHNCMTSEQIKAVKSTAQKGLKNV
jgi:hypothetical protein